MMSYISSPLYMKKNMFLAGMLLIVAGCTPTNTVNVNSNANSQSNLNLNSQVTNTNASTFSRVKHAGEMCGGIAGFICDTGLVCQYDGNYPDAGGVCVKAPAAAQEGQNCGGIAKIQCANGLFCRETPTTTDEYGVCVKNSAENILSFDDCVAAGNPVMESYPRQCKTPAGKTFTEQVAMPAASNENATDGKKPACTKDEDCACRNFDGTQFLPGTVPGSCDVDTGVCRPCFYR